MNTVEARVARGAALFDDLLPPTWPAAIDLGRLRVASYDCCPVAQLAPMLMEHHTPWRTVREIHDWALGLNVIRRCIPYLSPDFPAHHGFAGGDYEALDAAWCSLIKERLDAGVTVE